MTISTSGNSSKANQAYLTEELRKLWNEMEVFHAAKYNYEVSERNYTQTSDTDSTKFENDHSNVFYPLDYLVERLQLSVFEKKILLMCVGVELDSEFSAFVAKVQGNSALIHPTFSLALSIFPEAHWNAVTPDAPLRYWQLIEMISGGIITGSALRVEEHILHLIAGVYHVHEKLAEIAEPVVEEGYLVPSHKKISNEIVQEYSLKNTFNKITIIQFKDGNISDQRLIAADVCKAVGFNLYYVSALALFSNSKDFTSWLRLWNREAILNGFALFLDCTEFDPSDRSKSQVVNNFIERVEGPLFISCSKWSPEVKRSKMVLEVLKPTADEQLAVWQTCLGEVGKKLNGQLKKLVAQFNLNAKTIEWSSREVLKTMPEIITFPKEELEEKLWKLCCTNTRLKLEDLANRIEPVSTWDDLVLPANQKEILAEIVMHVKQRNKVYEEWGFAGKSQRGLGISALFCGESGTGKTMASEVLANELKLDLYRIDLSQVVNKYIGETEKNLKKIFDAAEEAGAILLFDEADALFGKRSDVKDSHDRYSNIEVSYLLQRMETFSGLAILTTNMKSALDKAFFRRIRFVIQFPFPDSAQRAEIWKRVFPAKTPTDNLDFDKLARLNIPGGNIRNIGMNAAFIAAHEGQAVQMSHISRAARNEFNKLERPLTGAEIGGW